MKKSPLRRKSKLKDTSAKNAAKNRKYRKVKLTVCICGSEAVHRHHIYAQGDKPWMDTEALNILPLCQKCHEEAHKDMKGFRLNLRKTMRSRMEVLDGMAKYGGKSNQGRVYDN